MNRYFAVFGVFFAALASRVLFLARQTARSSYELRYYSLSDFDSKDPDGSGRGTGQFMKPLALERLDLLTDDLRVSYPSYGRFQINSAYRTVAHNARVGGSPDSAHLKGWAYDIHTPNAEFKQWLIAVARARGFRRIGIYNTFVHLDSDPTKLYQGEWDKRTIVP